MPPLTIESAAALVGGGTKVPQEQSMSTVPVTPPAVLKATVVRAFYFQGKVLEVGKTFELPRVFALEMQAARKVSIAEDPPAQAEASDQKPAKAARASAVKGDKDAG